MVAGARVVEPTLLRVAGGDGIVVAAKIRHRATRNLASFDGVVLGVLVDAGALSDRTEPFAIFAADPVATGSGRRAVGLFLADHVDFVGVVQAAAHCVAERIARDRPAAASSTRRGKPRCDV